MEELAFAGAGQLAEGILAGRLSSRELVQAHLDRIEGAGSALTAVVRLDGEVALARAAEADEALARGESWGPLHGVPITVKDAFETAGLETTASYPPLRDHVPERDAVVVARLRDAGAIVLGKTNLSMLATDVQTDSPIFGRTDNPWDPERTPGGSSGGSAAAVAAGLSPLDVGSDLGGSVRLPAHFCGVYGLKPTEGRVAAVGHIPDWTIPGVSGELIPVQHMGCYGPLARTVEDLELCLRLVEGPARRQAALPPGPGDRDTGVRLADCRVAWSDGFPGSPVSRETRRALECAAAELEEHGCRVERVEPTDFDFELAWRTWGEIVAAELTVALPLKLRLGFAVLFSTSGSPPMDRGIVRGILSSHRRYRRALSRRERLINDMERFLSGWDAWLCPASARAAFRHRRTGAPVEVDGERVPYMMAIASHTVVFNLTGHPVVTIPLRRDEGELPLGVQVVGRRWQDRRLLGLAGAASEVVGGFRAPPALG